MPASLRDLVEWVKHTVGEFTRDGRDVTAALTGAALALMVMTRWPSAFGGCISPESTTAALIVLAVGHVFWRKYTEGRDKRRWQEVHAKAAGWVGMNIVEGMATDDHGKFWIEADLFTGAPGGKKIVAIPKANKDEPQEPIYVDVAVRSTGRGRVVRLHSKKVEIHLPEGAGRERVRFEVDGGPTFLGFEGDTPVHKMYFVLGALTGSQNDVTAYGQVEVIRRG